MDCRPIRAYEHHRHKCTGLRDGKTDQFRRNSGADRSNGSGVQYAIREFFREPLDIAKAGLKGTIEGKRVVIQGLAMWATMLRSF